MDNKPKRPIRDNFWYFDDSTWMAHLFKQKSRYYVRVKGSMDGAKQIISPPCREGFYHDQYMAANKLTQDGLPF